MKVCIATSREIGEKCIEWAKENMPKGFELTDDINGCEIFISVLYANLISEEFINSKKACFNFHPGILPKYRGSGTFSWSIIDEEPEAGITLHKIDKGIDSGNVIEVKEFRILKDDTAYDLFKRGENILFGMFQNWFEKLLTNQYPLYGQIPELSKIYYRKDLDKAKDLTRFARAFHFPGKEQAYYFNKKGEKIYLEYEGTTQGK